MPPTGDPLTPGPAGAPRASLPFLVGLGCALIVLAVALAPWKDLRPLIVTLG